MKTLFFVVISLLVYHSTGARGVLLPLCGGVGEHRILSETEIGVGK